MSSVSIVSASSGIRSQEAAAASTGEGAENWLDVLFSTLDATGLDGGEGIPGDGGEGELLATELIAEEDAVLDGEGEFDLLIDDSAGKSLPTDELVSQLAAEQRALLPNSAESDAIVAEGEEQLADESALGAEAESQQQTPEGYAAEGAQQAEEAETAESISDLYPDAVPGVATAAAAVTVPQSSTTPTRAQSAIAAPTSAQTVTPSSERIDNHSGVVEEPIEPEDFIQQHARTERGLDTVAARTQTTAPPNNNIDVTKEDKDEFELTLDDDGLSLDPDLESTAPLTNSRLASAINSALAGSAPNGTTTGAVVSDTASATRSQATAVTATASAATAAAADADASLTSDWTLSAHPEDAEWGTQVAERVLVMTQQSIKHATIQLTPEELGHLEIKIQLDGDEAEVEFNVQHADTREALEQSAQKLKDLLAEEGIKLKDSEVNDQTNPNAEGEANESRAQANAEKSGTESEEDAALAEQSLHWVAEPAGRGIDFFA